MELYLGTNQKMAGKVTTQEKYINLFKVFGASEFLFEVLFLLKDNHIG